MEVPVSKLEMLIRDVGTLCGGSSERSRLKERGLGSSWVDGRQPRGMAVQGLRRRQHRGALEGNW